MAKIVIGHGISNQYRGEMELSAAWYAAIFGRVFVFYNFCRINKSTTSMKSVLAAKTGFHVTVMAQFVFPRWQRPQGRTRKACRNS
jgi:hypothetical protein